MDREWHLDASNCVDLARGGLDCSSMRCINKALEFFLEADEITVVRVKNRFYKPAPGGWRDVLINFFFADDRERHICEIQVMHTHLLSVREDMGAHHEYSAFRSAVDIVAWYEATGPTEKEMKGITGSCPVGHALKPLIVRDGTCARCARRPPSGWLALVCTSCEWWACKDCAPSCVPWIDAGFSCEKRHRLVPKKDIGGVCGSCADEIRPGRYVAECEECNMSLCDSCTQARSLLAIPVAHSWTHIANAETVPDVGAEMGI